MDLAHPTSQPAAGMCRPVPAYVKAKGHVYECLIFLVCCFNPDMAMNEKKITHAKTQSYFYCCSKSRLFHRTFIQVIPAAAQ